MKRWGEGLTRDDREEVRAAGRAILLLSEEIESLHIELWHANDRGGDGGTAPAEPALVPDEPEALVESAESDDGDVGVKLRERLSAFRFSHR
ncbi:MAG TPA: hypothetical protein VIU81_02315 [Gaiellaceae bacterium]